MQTTRHDRGASFTKIMAWIAVVGGLAILVVDFVRGDGISLVGAGAAVVGGAVLFSSRGNASELEGPAGGGEGP